MGQLEEKLEKKYHISHSSQGFVSSCVGPVVDVCLQSPSGEGPLALGTSALSSSLAMDYSPCVYDSILLIRPACSFREGLSLNNIPSSNSSYYERLGKTSLIFGLGQMVGIAYTKKKASLRQIRNEYEGELLSTASWFLAAALIL